MRAGLLVAPCEWVDGGVNWQSIFAPSIPLLEGFVCGTVTYLVLLALIRLVGQRESGALGAEVSGATRSRAARPPRRSSGR